MRNYKPTDFTVLVAIFLFTSCSGSPQQVSPDSSIKVPAKKEPATTVDTAAYKRLVQYISHGDTTGRWPVKDSFPKAGAILPFYRIVSYYGNLYSRQMGILGELPKDSMLRRLKFEVNKWSKADSMLPVMPALHYICVTAQGSPGAGNTYRLRMPFHQIDTILNWAKEINALVFLDVQVGLSTLEKELPQLEKYLSLPNVHLGIDPEFSMKTGKKPGTVIGTMDATDINYAINYLRGLVEKNNLPPKILVIHRFTRPMVTNYKNIKTNPSVQIVMDMDGWGIAARKVNTYRSFIYPEPVQFTGFKIFYKNDTKRVNAEREMQPADVLKLTPNPVYIQYQ
jgi:hypothetical protein